MPIITLEGPQIDDLDKRRQLISQVTAAAADYYAMPAEKIIVLVKSNTPDNVAVGGKLISDL
jgi:4-oxalocrotonate tautomerase